MGAFDGFWILQQSNGFTVRLDLNPPDGGGNFTGTADYPGMNGDIVNGHLADPDTVFEINWKNGQRGRYSGRHGLDGNWSGDSVDLGNPHSQATWFAHRE
jgi:hypothetical protein